MKKKIHYNFLQSISYCLYEKLKIRNFSTFTFSLNWVLLECTLWQHSDCQEIFSDFSFSFIHPKHISNNALIIKTNTLKWKTNALIIKTNTLKVKPNALIIKTNVLITKICSYLQWHEPQVIQPSTIDQKWQNRPK